MLLLFYPTQNIFAVKEEEGTLSLNTLDVLIVFEDDVCQVLGQCTGAFYFIFIFLH